MKPPPPISMTDIKTCPKRKPSSRQTEEESAYLCGRGQKGRASILLRGAAPVVVVAEVAATGDEQDRQGPGPRQEATT